jgi:kynurenine formamidase
LIVRLVDLTLPLDHDWMPDEALPSAAAFVVAPQTHPDKGFLVGTETGTCLTLPAQFDEHRKTRRLHDLAPEALVLRPTVLLDVPAGEGATLAAETLRQALGSLRVERGDAVLLRTGWGDQGRERLGGSGYLLKGPRLALEAARALAQFMRDRGSDLLMTDLPLLAHLDAHQVPEWTTLLPRPRAYPSTESQMYLHLYRREQADADYAVARVLAASGIMTVKRLVGCGTLAAPRFRIIVGPLHLVRGIGATCRVIALEEDSR